MNCVSCQESLSDYLDDSLEREAQVQLSAHLSDCTSCSALHDELSTIVSCGAEYRDHLMETPPNPQALWLRISNIIESECQPAAEIAVGTPARSANWFARTWRFTLPQLAGAVAVLVIGVSALTTLGLRGFSSNSDLASAPNSPSRKGANADQAREQQIAYWNERVQQRKAQWNQQTREAFDRNVQILDQAVADYRRELQLNPNDEVSAEMLNSALNEKIALLQDFAE